MALQPAQVRAAGGVERRAFPDLHLAVQDVDALGAELGGTVHHGLDGHLRRLEVPVRVGGDGELGAAAVRGRGGGGAGATE